MANIKIAQLTEKTALADTDIVIVEDATGTKKMTVANLKNTLAAKDKAQMVKITADDGNAIAGVTDCNAALAPGLYSILSGVLNIPQGLPNNYNTLRVSRRSASYITQEVLSHSTNELFMRGSVNAGGAWTNWVKLAKADTAQMYKFVGDDGNAKTYLDGVNLNTVLGPGVYNVAASCTNIPGGDNGILTIKTRQGNQVFQRFNDLGGLSDYVRTSTNSGVNWGPWKETTNIVESGSNANGSYIKYSDGTMICRLLKVATQAATYLTATVTFPAAFIDGNVTMTSQVRAMASALGWAGIVANRTTSSSGTGTTIYIYPVSGSFASGDTANVDIIAIGRWK